MHSFKLNPDELRVESLIVGGGARIGGEYGTEQCSAITCSGTCSPAWCPVPTGQH